MQVDRLLVITQEMDEESALLGFFLGWVRELSKHFDEVHVAYLKGRGADISENVFLHKLAGGKVGKVLQLNKLIMDLRPKWILAHMCPEFVVSAYPAAKAVGAPVTMFYAHGGVSNALRMAERLAAKVITTTEGGFRINSGKKVVIHQGIDTKRFYCGEERYMLDVGRVSRIKNHDLVIRAFSEIGKGELWIAGSAPALEKGVMGELKALAKEKGVENRVKFLGDVPNAKMPGIYADCVLFVSASETGSLDKTGLEAMAAGKPVLVCNEAYGGILKGFEEYCFFKKKDSADLSAKMRVLLADSGLRRRIGDELRRRVEREHSVEDLMERIAEEIKSCKTVKK